MYKFLITIQCQPGTREKILARAPEAQAATRAEPGCLQYDFFACSDDPDKLVFVETWVDEAAHGVHMGHQHTKDFIAYHEQFHVSLSFETVNIGGAAA